MKPAASCVSNTRVTSVLQLRRRIAMSWRPACTSTSTVRVGEHARERLRVERLVAERVEHLGAHAVRRVGIGDRHLGEAQQRLVAALRDELGVDRHPSVG